MLKDGCKKSRRRRKRAAGGTRRFEYVKKKPFLPEEKQAGSFPFFLVSGFQIRFVRLIRSGGLVFALDVRVRRIGFIGFFSLVGDHHPLFLDRGMCLSLDFEFFDSFPPRPTTSCIIS